VKIVQRSKIKVERETANDRYLAVAFVF